METGNFTQNVPKSLGLLKYVAQRKELERIEGKRSETMKLYRQSESKLLVKNSELEASEMKLLAKTEALKKCEADLLAKSEELKKKSAVNLAQTEKLMMSEIPVQEAVNLLLENDSRKNDLERIVKERKDEVENLKRANAHYEQVQNFEVEHLEGQLVQSERQVEDHKEALGKSDSEKIELKERVTLEQKKYDELVAWLGGARKKWESEKEQLCSINAELVKQLEDAKKKQIIENDFEVVDDGFHII